MKKGRNVTFFTAATMPEMILRDECSQMRTLEQEHGLAPMRSRNITLPLTPHFSHPMQCLDVGIDRCFRLDSCSCVADPHVKTSAS